jgi:hypothetical protein
MDTSERITVETPKHITRRRRSAGLSKLRTNAFASEHDLPPDAYWDQDNEQTHKKRKKNNRSPGTEIATFARDILHGRVRGKPYQNVSRHRFSPKADGRDKAIRQSVGPGQLRRRRPRA